MRHTGPTRPGTSEPSRPEARALQDVSGDCRTNDDRAPLPLLGNLAADFNFSQAPRPPLPLNPPTDSRTIPSYFFGRSPCPGCTTPPG